MTFLVNGTSGLTFPDSSTQAAAGLVSGGTIASGTITTGTVTTLTSTTATVTTLKAPSGVLAVQNGMTGIAKAWVNFVGSSGSINNSFNVSSVTRLGNGAYTINFTTAMPNANYCSCGATLPTAGGNPHYLFYVENRDSQQKTTTALNTYFLNPVSGVAQDPTTGMVMIFGS